MIGIYGGTFDPVHFGHLRPAVDVYDGLGLQQVRMIPCGQPPHRQPPVASASQRLQMLNLAVAKESGLVVDDREITREGNSYMVDTLASLKQDLPGEVFCLILGMDAFNEFDTWKDWTSILELAHIVVTHRPNSVFDEKQAGQQLTSYVIEHSAKDKTELSLTSHGRILFFPVTQLDISSTQIRNFIALGKSIHFLTPAAVVRYILQNRIYK